MQYKAYIQNYVKKNIEKLHISRHINKHGFQQEFSKTMAMHFIGQTDGIVQDCSISNANKLEILQSCTNPSKYHIVPYTKHRCHYTNITEYDKHIPHYLNYLDKSHRHWAKLCDINSLWPGDAIRHRRWSTLTQVMVCGPKSTKSLPELLLPSQ